MNSVLDQIKKEKIIAIIRGVDSADILQVLRALYDGGLRAAEITFDHTRDDNGRNTLASIRKAVENYGDKMYIGAGTVLTAQEVEQTKEVGGRFIISPNINSKVISRTKELELVSIPGAMTPTEAEAAWIYGADIIKMFPAGNLGSAYIKSVKSSLNHLTYFAVGGVTSENIGEFWSAGAEGFGIGSNLVNAGLVRYAKYDEIQKRAEAFHMAAEKECI